MKKLIFKSLLTLFVLLFASPMFATHSAGMDLTYKCLGGNQYEFTLKLIRFCGGVNVPDEYYLNVTSNSCNTDRQVIMNRVAPGTDITPICVGVSTNCDDPNSTIQGYQEHVFKGIVTLDLPCNDWRAVVCDHARNNDISTVQNAGKSSLCVSALINNVDAPCNNSPYFKNRPNAFVCVNNNLCFNNVVVDDEGDELVFDLDKPKKCIRSGGCYSNNYVDYNELTPLTYVSSSLSHTDPFMFAPPIDLDPQSGNFCIQPTGIEKTVMAIRVREYRNGVLIGEVVRDIQVVVFQCDNQVPQLGGINNINSGNTDTIAEAGDFMTFQVSSFDPDFQSLNMSASNLPTGASFDINNAGNFPVGTFSWLPQVNDTGVVCFNVEVNDLSGGNCSYFATASKSFCIEVKDCQNSALEIQAPSTVCSNEQITLSTNLGIGFDFWSGQGVVDPVQGTYNASNVSGQFDTLRLENTLSNGCVKNFEKVIEIIQAPKTNLQSSSLISCPGKTLNLTANPDFNASNTGSYSFFWNPSNVLDNPQSFNPSAIISGATNFEVQVVDNATGCSQTDELFIAFSSDAPFVQAALDDSICTGGDVYLGGLPTASQGTPPYSYQWSSSTFLSSDTLANPLFSGTSSMSYELSVTDINGCVGTDLVYVEVISGFMADATGGVDTFCTSGQVQLGADESQIGGQAPYNINWYPSTHLDNSTIYNPIFSAPNQTPAYYDYVLEVVDANGCVDLDWAVVFVNPDAVIAQAAADDTVCTYNGIQLGGNPTAQNGIDPYTYLWTPNQNISNNQIANPWVYPTVSTDYTLKVTDADGCSDLDFVHVRKSNGPIADAGGNSGDTLCTGGSAYLGGNPTASNGVFPYTYNWSPQAQLNNPGIANPLFSGQQSGWYTLVLSDESNCFAVDSVFVNVISGFSADAGNGSDTLCTSQSILLGGDATQIGGTSPYSFDWNPSNNLNDAATYNPIFTGSSSVPTYFDYELIVTDAQGCVDIDSVVVFLNPDAVLASAGPSDTVCTGGSIQLGGDPTAVGGLAPFSYEWIPNQNINDHTIADPVVSLSADQLYVVSVTDAEGCSDIDSIYVQKTAGPIADAGADTVCTGGTIYLGGNPTASNGVFPYTYEWIPNQYLNTSNSASNPAAYPPTSQYYVVSVTDESGCSDLDSVYVQVVNGPKAEAGNLEGLCTGGEVQLGGDPTAILGQQPYTYNWNNAQFLDDASISNPIASGIFDTVDFVLVLTDADGCVDIDTAVVFYNFKAPIADAGFGQDTLCSSGQIFLGGNPTVTFGAPPFQYTWTPSTDLNSPSSANPITSTTSTTTYTLLVVDSNGCSDLDDVVVVFNPDGPTAEAGFGQDTICSGGTVMLGGAPTANGGIAPFTYNWIPNYALTSNSVANPLTTTQIDTSYMVIVTDSEGCSDLDSVYVDYNPNGPKAEAGGVNDFLCTGGTIILGGNPTVTDGTAPFSYLWTPSTGILDTTASNPFATIQADQQYVLFVEDADGCRDIDSVFVSFSGPKAEAGFGQDTLCIIDVQTLGGNPTAQGGTAPYFYNWAPDFALTDNDVANPQTFTPVDTTYVLTVVDANGCIDIDSVYLQHVELEASFVPIVDDQIAPADVLFENTSQAGMGVDQMSFWWEFGDSTGYTSTDVNPFYTYYEGGEMTVTLVAYSDQTQLCSDTFAYTIVIYPPAELVIPNVITPNGDGFNDFFEVDDRGIEQFKCTIYNRWGTQVYNFDELDNKWDGRSYSGVELPEGTYFYWIEASGYDRSEHSLKGTFTLFR